PPLMRVRALLERGSKCSERVPPHEARRPPLGFAREPVVANREPRAGAIALEQKRDRCLRMKCRGMARDLEPNGRREVVDSPGNLVSIPELDRERSVWHELEIHGAEPA